MIHLCANPFWRQLDSLAGVQRAFMFQIRFRRPIKILRLRTIYRHQLKSVVSYRHYVVAIQPKDEIEGIDDLGFRQRSLRMERNGE